MNPLDHLYLHKYRITLKPKETIHLPPYKGSAFRGVFGYALRRVVCVTRKTVCDDCMLRHKCIYSAIMETPVPPDCPDHRKYRKAPHPYIIVPPLTRKQNFKPDDLISFEMTLIGRANDYLPYFVYTFTEMGRIGIGRDRGKFDVSSVRAINLDGSSIEVFNGLKWEMRPSKNRIDYSCFTGSSPLGPFPVKEDRNGVDETSESEITISFETPLRIKENNKLSADVPFNLLISRLSERAFLLAHLHCGAEPGDYEGFAEGSQNVKIIRNNLRWIDWERYSTRQQTKMKFGGLVGEITYKGNFHKYMPLLRLGEYIHVGKATTFGLGKYRIK